MRKIFALIAILALFTVHTAKAEIYYGFMDNKYYDVAGDLKIFGFADGKYYNINQQEVYKVNGTFQLTPPDQDVASPNNVADIPAGGIGQSLPEVNVVIPQPAIITPTGTTTLTSPLILDLCPNIDGNQPTLPSSIILSNGICLSSTTTPITNITANGTVISMVIGNISVMPKIEYSLNADMGNSQLELQRRDSSGNTIDACLLNSNYSTQLSLSENLLPHTTYYFRVKAYQCGVANYTPWQLYLGQTDVYQFTTP